MCRAVRFVFLCSDADSGDAEMVDEEHIGVNAIMGGKKRKTPDADGEAAPKAPKQPKVWLRPSWDRP
jgi:hypothetical protein